MGRGRRGLILDVRILERDRRILLDVRRVKGKGEERGFLFTCGLLVFFREGEEVRVANRCFKELK